MLKFAKKNIFKCSLRYIRYEEGKKWFRDVMGRRKKIEKSRHEKIMNALFVKSLNEKNELELLKGLFWWQKRKMQSLFVVSSV